MYLGFDYGIRLDLRHCPCGAYAVAGAEKGRARYRVSAGADGRGDFTFAGVQRGRKCGAAFFRSALAVRLGFRAVSAGVQGSRCAVVVRITAALCRDAGQSALAAKMEIAGAVLTLSVCLPLFEQVLDLITEWAV
ncbi:MAG: SpoIIIAC/SpoIIIAD family protein [Butyricicoccus sp.]